MLIGLYFRGPLVIRHLVVRIGVRGGEPSSHGEHESVDPATLLLAVSFTCHFVHLVPPL
jgi:hypothetical protein